jgi:uncharacterized protein (UPF0179 family)
LCLREVSAGDGQAAEEGLRKRVARVREEGHPPGVSDGDISHVNRLHSHLTANLKRRISDGIRI